MPEVAKNMVLDYAAGKVTVAGKDFPYCVADEDIEARAQEGGWAVVYLPVLVKGLKVIPRD